ncbi:AMP-binding protein [Chrysosporum bergii ANA360D]|uniref:AMP-binding protein n=1 Tax=Chrysosporum bergii ANA360D TaxID=617107 RepID=A0AA43KD20_9CYAN|nr:AMP-binding protein [Chrysosporum bergii]MDH6061785.1 AMP-binding protein [Chrysosporum bergii ANA360D]
MSLATKNTATSLLQILSERAESQPQQQAYIFLQDGETETGSLTYQELHQQAINIASHLQCWQGERALLLYPSGLEFITAFFGCLYAGVVAVPVYPPKRNQKLSRLLSIAQDAQAKIALTTASILGNIDNQWQQSPQLAPLNLIATDTLTGHNAQFDTQPITPQTLAFLQYTSGSTGTPKGVMVTHGNIIHNEELIKTAFGNTQESIYVCWLPLFHDMGLIGNLLQTMYVGIPSILMPPEAFIQKPLRWLQAISKYRATTSGGPNFAYDLCTKKIQPEELAHLDLSSWELAFNGSEPVRAETLRQFSEKFAKCGFNHRAFYPCYGMAEITVFATGGDKQQQPVIKQIKATELEKNLAVQAETLSTDSREIVGCGHPHQDTNIIIVNPESLTENQPGEIGEIWVSSPSVAAGYWQRPQATAETFSAVLPDNQATAYLRTGDLGFISAGELFITGRLKDLIIIRGRNHYPQDIEITVEKSHPALRANSGAAFTVETEGEQKLVVVQEIERTHLRHLNKDEIVEAINQAVATEHELAIDSIVFLKPGSIAKTSSGKIQRRACQQMFLAGTWTELAHKRLSVASVPDIGQTLKKEQEKTNINIVNTTPTVKPNQEMPMSLDPKQTHAEDLLAWLREYARDRINSRQIDERRSIPPQIVLDFGRQKIFGMHISPEYNGLGLLHQDSLRVIAQLAAIDLTLAVLVAQSVYLGIWPIQKFADRHIQAELLPLLATGQQLACFALTEPVAGSNPRAIRTQAVPNALGGWGIRGKKIWIGNAAWAGTMNLFTQVVDGNGLTCGITGFVLPRHSPGVRIIGETLTMGLRGMVQNTLELEDVQVQPHQILGHLGHGLEVAKDAFQVERVGVGAMSVGGMKRCLQLMHRYTSRRSVSTGLLLHNPVTLLKMSEFAAATTAMEILINQTAIWLDRGMNLPEEVSILCKVAGSELLWQTADGLVQLLGGRGYDENNLVPQILRDARILRIGGGPSETLTLYVGASILNYKGKLFEFLRVTLQNPTLADWLAGIMEQIQGRCLKAPAVLADQQTALQWGYSLAGEIGLQTLMLAIIQFATAAHPSPHELQVQEWLRLRLEQTVSNVLKGQPAETALLNPKHLTELVNGWQTSIGDVEQSLHLQENTFDEMLKIQPHPTVDSLVFSSSHIRSTDTDAINHDEGTKELFNTSDYQASENHLIHDVNHVRNVIKDTIAKQLNINAQSVKSDATFISYGIDSLMAIELTHSLEKRIGQPLEPTLIWNHPTIELLAQYLTQVQE